MAFETLLPLIEKTGSTLAPEAFQHTVNVVFHDIEAEHYDAIHANMWGSLEEQVNLLVDDILAKEAVGDNLRMLDIGSGTGLSTQMLLASKLGKHIGHATLLDTSPEMLKRAEEKISKLGKPYDLVNSNAEALDGKYDVIIISSVLHHIPDLKRFLSKIDTLQNTGGILIHLQDPNGDYIDNANSRTRFTEYENQLKSGKKKNLKDLLPSSLLNFVNRMLGRKTYIDMVNDKLLELKAIRKRMTADEIWSVTDIHVENLPFSTGTGISMRFMTEKLRNYSLLSHRSYGFFGFLKSELLPGFQSREQSFIDKGALDGRNVSGAWIKK